MEYNTPMASTAGKRLKQIRESRDISLEEISQRTRIRLAYLEAIEEDDIESLPSRAQLRGFLRLYAHELGVDIEDLEVEAYHLPVMPEPDKPTSHRLPISQPPDEALQLSLAPDPSTGNVEALTRPPIKPSEEKIKDFISVEEEKYAPPKKASDIFSALGETLHKRREMLSLSLDDIHANTHVRIAYLKAFEAGRIDQLPSPVQAKGMLANYAEFLNLDVDSLLLEFADGLQVQRIEKQQLGQSQKQSSAKEVSPTMLRLKNFFSLDLLVVAGLFIGFAAFVIWGVDRIMDVDSPQTGATDLPEVAEVLLATGSPTPQLTNATDSEVSNGEPEDQTQEETPPIFTPASYNNPINIIILPRQRVWVQVTADSEVVFEGRLLDGNAYDFSAQETLEMLTGNAGALQIYFNDQIIGSPGLTGQVVDLVFTENGLVLPTPTNTPTITETPENTLTPTLTPTPSLTPTENND